jgi:hypothetical protein
MHDTDQLSPAFGGTFTEDLQSIDAFRLFNRALPGWSRSQGGISGGFIIEVLPEGVAIGMKLPPGHATEAAASSLMMRLKEEQRLMNLELLIDEMRNVGVVAEVLDPMITEAQELARALHPDTLWDESRG